MLLQAALAPAMICAIYLYIRDQYEKEPIRLLCIGLLFGAYSTSVILALGGLAEKYILIDWKKWDSFYTAFVTSSGIEESVKYLFLYFLVWKNKNFNERFDGIVYAVFVSLGFAGVENIIYVFNPVLGGLQTALSRAFVSVPGHALFGTAMGYYFALAKFESHHKKRHLIQAFVLPWILHGIYNFIVLMDSFWFFLLFFPFLAYLWYSGFKKMKIHIETSPFK